jgi:hypothetical protein
VWPLADADALDGASSCAVGAAACLVWASALAAARFTADAAAACALGDAAVVEVGEGVPPQPSAPRRTGLLGGMRAAGPLPPAGPAAGRGGPPVSTVPASVTVSPGTRRLALFDTLRGARARARPPAPPDYH